MDETVDFETRRPARTSAGREDVPDRIAGYRLIRKLGTGGMGTVFEAEDESHGQRVAIKLIAGEYAASEEAIERFRREGRLASAVTHPRCVFVLGVDDYRGRPFIVMELMRGTTLQTLVEQAGPLDPVTAIVKIFDVIEGLREFHKRGLIHRDVKPSNCFLDQGDRVKIGDFGLSKSLEGEVDLTRSGTFIGTPLYASPEQIKRDEVDERTDVYSVAATLYYLLAGQPPVLAKDATEALARIVSEPAPPLRSRRPNLPRALEAVILRGLERDPARRWRSLEELHDALVPFVPARLSIAGIGLRVGAYVIDLALSYLLSWAVVGLVVLYHQAEMMSTVRFYERHSELLGWSERVLWLLYFWVLEGAWGASLGKWIVGLRVSRLSPGGPPGMLRGLVRAAAFYGLTELPADLWVNIKPAAREPRAAVWYFFSERLIRGLGFLAIGSTMREKSGFRGPHEWLSGTRVVRVAWMRKPHLSRRFRSLADSRIEADVPTPAPIGVQEVGPYEIRGAARWQPNQKILLGHDSSLNRSVWIVIDSHESAHSSSSRRDLNRQSRPRWIGAGEHDEGRWDAFTAPAGVSLATLVESGGLGWRDVLPILCQLADELQAALADQTLPPRLTPEQVWLQPDGGVQLVDILDEAEAQGAESDRWGSSPPIAIGSPEVVDDSHTPARDERGAMNFLGDVARLALEGRHGGRPLAANRVPEVDARGQRIRAAVPVRAAALLDRLTGMRPPFESLQEVRRKLDLATERPMEVAVGRRALHLAIQTFFLLPGLIAMFAIGGGYLSPRFLRGQLDILVAIPLAWILWSFLTRGGYSLQLARIDLVRSDGRRASRLSCAVRAIMVWLLPTVLLVGSRYVQQTWAEASDASLALWIAAMIVLILELVLGLFFPQRGPHDRLAGTELVPF